MKIIYQEDGSPPPSNNRMVEYRNSNGSAIMYQDYNGVWHDAGGEGHGHDREFRRAIIFKRNPMGVPAEQDL